MALIKDLKAQIFSGIAGPLIEVTAKAHAGDFPEAVELALKELKGDQLLLELKNAVDAGSFKEVGYVQNLDSENELKEVTVYHNGELIASAKPAKGL